MKEEALALLFAVANKLGTTTEYLWGVLIQQAPIHALHKIFVIFVIVGILYWAYSVIQKGKEYWKEENTAHIWAFFCISVFIAMIGILISTRSILVGLLNPEYWALNYIMNYVNK